jgi:hypothetical protein
MSQDSGPHVPRDVTPGIGPWSVQIWGVSTLYKIVLQTLTQLLDMQRTHVAGP